MYMLMLLLYIYLLATTVSMEMVVLMCGVVVVAIVRCSNMDILRCVYHGGVGLLLTGVYT